MFVRAPCVCSAHGGQRRALDPWNWSSKWLWAAMWVLGAALGSSARTVREVSALNLGAISPAPYNSINTHPYKIKINCQKIQSSSKSRDYMSIQLKCLAQCLICTVSIHYMSVLMTLQLSVLCVLHNGGIWRKSPFVFSAGGVASSSPNDPDCMGCVQAKIIGNRCELFNIYVI